MKLIGGVTLRTYVVVSSLLFLFSILIGYLNSDVFFSFAMEFLDGVLETLSGKGSLYTSFFIMYNNIKVAFFSLLFGFTLVFPLFLILSNGFVIGAVLQKSIEEIGPVALLYLLPHGIFEIPALLLAFAYGLLIGVQFYLLVFVSVKHVFGLSSSKQFQKQFFTFKKILLRGLLLFLMLVIPLLIIAGFIEGMLVYLGA